RAPRLRGGGGRAPRQVHRAPARRRAEGRPRPRRGDVPGAARQHGDRGLPLRAGGLMHVSVIRFPGSNCDDDVLHVLSRVVAGSTAKMAWHKDAGLPPSDAVVVPGGFSYGDYLRAGAMAAHSPIMSSVKEFAARGGPVLGICNGFQILCEAGLLDGALLRNSSLRFECRDVHLVVEGIPT